MTPSPHLQYRDAAFRRRSLAREARAVLFYRSNWLSALFVLFSAMLLLQACRYFFDCIYYAAMYSGLFPTANAAMTEALHPPISFAFCFLMLSPLAFGIYAYFYDMRISAAEETAPPPPAEVFCFYTSMYSVFRIWWIALLALLPLCALPAALFLTKLAGRLLDGFFADIRIFSLVGVSRGLTLALGFLLVLLALWVASGSVPLVHLTVTRPERRGWDCLLKSFSVMRGYAGEFLLLLLSYTPWLLLSLLLCGIPLLLYLLPLGLLVYIGFCSSVLLETGVL